MTHTVHDAEKPSFSDYVVYVDESGDHGLKHLDPSYPVFVLAFCIFQKVHYYETIVPMMERFKFLHFGHDLVVLHEHEIRKEKGLFNYFQGREHKQRFLRDLSDLVAAADFNLVTCVVDKLQLKKKLGSEIPSNPYHIALAACFPTLQMFLQERGQDSLLTHVIFECRGKKEDQELELEFYSLCAATNANGKAPKLQILFADKKINSVGLQLADLVARPVGINHLRPFQENRAYDLLKMKFFEHEGEEKGRHVLPAPRKAKSLDETHRG